MELLALLLLGFGGYLLVSKKDQVSKGAAPAGSSGSPEGVNATLVPPPPTANSAQKAAFAGEPSVYTPGALQTLWSDAWDQIAKTETPSSPLSIPDLFGGLGGLGGGGLGRSTLPSGSQLQKIGGAEAPITPGERVTFLVRREDGGSALVEGVYQGSGRTDEPSVVVVDRLAWDGGLPVELGPFNVPAGDKTGYHTLLDRVEWTVEDPKNVGLESFAVLPYVEDGDKATLVVRDVGGGSKAIVIVTVRKVDGDKITVSLDKLYRQLSNYGKGDFIMPKVYAQSLLETTRSMLVNPKSIPAKS